MGAWRRIDVDDRVITDEHSQRMLPWLKSNELWLPLLCKALLKVAAVESPQSFSPFTCLTGWPSQRMELGYHYVTETWNFLKTLLPEWKRLSKENKHDAVEPKRPGYSAPFVFVEVKEPKVVQLCENTRSVMEADFVAELEATPQKVLLQAQRQQSLIAPEDLPPVPAWKKVRGPPRSLKEDEEHEPIRSVLMRLLKNGKSGGGSGATEERGEKVSDFTQGIESNEIANMNCWFDIEDVCKFFSELQAFYNPEDLAFRETLTVVKNAEEEAVVSEESYLFVDSLDNIEVILDFHASGCGIQNGISTLVRIEPTDWLSPCRHPPITTLSMENRQSVSLRLPPGRHCYRIFLETPLAISLDLFVPYANRERTLFVLGPMETCMQVAVKEPLQNAHNGSQFLSKFCEIAQSFIDATEESESTAIQHKKARSSFINYAEKILPQKSMRTLEKVIRENFAKLIAKHSGNKDPAIISDAKFSWKILILDPNDELKVEETRAEDEPSPTKVSDFQSDNKLTNSVVKGIVAYQALFRGHMVRRILRSAKFPFSEDKTILPDIQRTVRGLEYLLDCLNKTTDSEKVALLRNIGRQLGCRCLPDDANFFTQKLQTGTFSDVSVKPAGCIWSAPANYVQSDSRKQYLNPLFHQMIFISEDLAQFRIRLESDEGVARVIVINNDSGCAIELEKGHYLALEVNRLGYCLLAYVLSDDQVNSNSNWQFACLCEGWRELGFPEAHSCFAFWEANGVLEAGEDGLLFRFSLDITLRQVISVILKMGKSTLPTRLILRSNDGSKLVTAHEESEGVQLMPALLLGPDLNLEAGGSATKCDTLDALQDGNKAAEDSKSSKGSYNHEGFKETDVEKSSPIEGADSNTQKTDSVRNYILEAYVKVDELHLSEEEMTMIAKIKEARVNEMRVDYEEKPSVAPSDLDSRKAKTRVASVRRAHTEEHPTLPSWSCKVYFDASNPESVVLKPYGPTPTELRAIRRSWLGENPSLRLEEARKLRQAYILTKSSEDSIRTEDIVEIKTENAGFGIPAVDEEEYAEVESILSCTYGEECQSGLEVPPNVNGANLKHNSAEHIHQEIWKVIRLAEEYQIAEMKTRKLLIQ